MLVSAVLTSEDNEKVSGIECVKAARYKVDNRD